MARLMLTVGDMQAWVQPVFGSVNPHAAMVVDEGHPLAVGDHEVGFFEPAHDGGPDNHASAIMGENDALQLIAVWLAADEGFAASLNAQKLLERTFNPTRDPAKNIGWLLP